MLPPFQNMHLATSLSTRANTVYGPLEQKLANHEQGLTSQQRFLPFDSLNVKCLLLLNASPHTHTHVYIYTYMYIYICIICIYTHTKYSDVYLWIDVSFLSLYSSFIFS